MEIHSAKILFVEDQELIARPVVSALRGVFSSCTWVQSAREMREVIPELEPDVLILDTTLETDGLEYYQAIRFAPEHPRCGVIIMTEEGDRLTKERAKQLGAAAVIAKPIVPETLIATIEHLVSLLPSGT